MRLVDVKLNLSDLHFETIWFHGTRTNDLESFKINGIKKTSEISPKLEKFLRDLSGGISKTKLSEAHSNFRYQIKKGLKVSFTKTIMIFSLNDFKKDRTN